MKDKYIKDCPCWISQYFFNANVNFEEPYNKDTLEYLNILFNHGLMQKIYKLIEIEYQDPEIQKALYGFIMNAWNEKMKNENLSIMEV